MGKRVSPGRALLGKAPPVNETQAGQEGADDVPGQALNGLFLTGLNSWATTGVYAARILLGGAEGML